MTISHTAQRWTRRLAFLAGLAVAAGLVAGWRMPPGKGALGLDLRIVSASTGELEVSPPGAVARGLALRPGHGAASGTVAIKNLTGATVEVHARALSAVRDLDGPVQLRLDAGGRPMVSAPLGAVRRWSPGGVRIAAQQTRTVRLRAWIPAHAGSGWEGRIADVQLELQARSLAGGGS